MLNAVLYGGKLNTNAKSCFEALHGISSSETQDKENKWLS